MAHTLYALSSEDSEDNNVVLNSLFLNSGVIIVPEILLAFLTLLNNNNFECNNVKTDNKPKIQTINMNT